MDASTPTKPRPAADASVKTESAMVDVSTPTKVVPNVTVAEDVARAGVVDISAFIATSSTPQSPILSAAPVTLVDALSPTHILDANSATSGIPLDYLDLDAPGSPDPTIAYFPPPPHATEAKHEHGW